MQTKVIAAILALFIAGIVCFAYIGKAQELQEPVVQSVAIPSADSTTKKVVDSTKVIRDEFVAQKENLRDKVEYLQQQQRRIKETQKQIDSITNLAVIFSAIQLVNGIPPQ